MDSRNYIPDAVYTICGEYTQNCGKCSNQVYSNVLNTVVHDTQRGKVFCPFGADGSMNKSIFADQAFLNTVNTINTNGYRTSQWGHAPQLDPRPLARIGLSFRTS